MEHRRPSAARALPPIVRRLTFVIISVVAAIAIGSASCGEAGGSPPALTQPDQTGAELATTFITLLANKDVDGLQDFLSDGFMLQRANGSFATKSDYLTNLPEIGPFTISDVTARQDAGALSVRWTLTVDQVIDGQRYAGGPAPRLSTFVWSDGAWRLIAHANFNVPVT